MLTSRDKTVLSEHGISEADFEAQMERFKKGFPYLDVESVATVGHGIMRLTPKEETRYIKLWNEFRQNGGDITKFVPASGAASRMFKDMFAFVSSGRNEPETPFEKKYFDEITRFAFYPALNRECKRRFDEYIPQLIEKGRHVDVVKAMLEEDGLNYGQLPKGLLLFHKAAAGKVHTPVEEHLEEGAQYASNSKREVKIHFTVSPEHRSAFRDLLKDNLAAYEKVWGVKYDVTMSEQKPSTDTAAAKANGMPFRDKDGDIVFRPAGHGALLENLNDLDTEVVFIKNIDNVVPSKLRSDTVRYKKVIGGYLIDLHQQISKFLTRLDDEDVTRAEMRRMMSFLENRLNVDNHTATHLDDKYMNMYLRAMLNRPIRVCGMVPNEGEPGGGPYIVKANDGSSSPQILEAAQINADDPKAVEMMKSGTHFNPVDLVCYIKDYKGEKFDLKKYVDPETGLISLKSKNGVEFKALELPGLWNGSMSKWNTVFIEVPITTFNPVKTVNDLLRPQHQ